jgi:hypothetical protein
LSERNSVLTGTTQRSEEGWVTHTAMLSTAKQPFDSTMIPPITKSIPITAWQVSPRRATNRSQCRPWTWSTTRPTSPPRPIPLTNRVTSPSTKKYRCRRAIWSSVTRNSRASTCQTSRKAFRTTLPTSPTICIGSINQSKETSPKAWTSQSRWGRHRSIAPCRTNAN